ncbi:GNAT family N-acetyltransferase [Streptococcus sanguinis]|uniref:GNAT family N-acetyltransferase n=1 Tax=Streptococcus sanguinis TaxID=1305 RepID=UPI000F667CE8|nr:GNAT family N-acetyltransferase [Streptococcus sanguinis]MBF1697862.1 GNAT family N-acetyltransferase [Streptococcus cristatus]MBZ2068841.1 GNAT family N-acetyltransferase [Streptococcus sanguinis]RSI21353.1 acetyltransferase [Streptococcus sanguinis]
MEKFHDFIKRVFDEQYEACFGPDMLEKLELQDYYLTREEDGQLIALLHAQQVLENIHVKALVVDKEHQKKGLGASLLAELEEKAVEAGVTSITLSTKSYQARDFYIKQGYEIYASLTDVPQKGITKYHFIKRLNEASLK